ncbi:MAG: SGNH/GDSL hydrolase family protein [Bacteroidota bacterium]
MSKFPFHRKLIYTSIIFFVFLFLLTIIGETGIRLFTGDKYKKPIPYPPYNSVVPDKKLGWKPKPFYFFEGHLKDLSNQEYSVSFQLDKNGFKTFGDSNSLKYKTLYIGDSYTAGIEVSTEKTFYSLLKDSLEMEIFAFGQAGYGTLQEYLILDRWIDRINPDLIVWQFCCNDFIDNYAPLEIKCGYKIGKRRPYLNKSGNIYYQRPLSYWQKIKEKILFYRWLEDHWHPFKKKVFGKDRLQGEDFIETWREEYGPFNQSVLITDLILKKLKKRLTENKKIIAFAADYYPAQIEAAKKIFDHHDIPFYTAPAEAIVAHQTNVNCRAADGYHWNEQGHQVVAAALFPYISEIYSKTQQAPIKTKEF